VTAARTTAGVEADAIVVGAGPAGSAAAYHLAQSGLDVVLLEKTAFPREKVCGDGLTPRATRQLVRMGIDLSPEAGWLHNRGLRILGGGHRLELDWPDLATYPPYGLVRRRLDFDEILARQAVKAGARLYESTPVTGPVLDERTGRVVGVRARTLGDRTLGESRAGGDGADQGPETVYRAPVVLAADGNSSRLSLSVGLRRREDRPMGVAVRTYYRSPQHDDDFLESWLELWDRTDPAAPKLLPGYGWIFGMGDGTCNVGLGILNTSSAFQNVDYRKLLGSWLEGTPEELGFREPNREGAVRGAALPMGFNRQPHYTNGLMLVGDAGGMVNPFNGEGIAYAMESGEIAAEVVAQAVARRSDAERERALQAYPRVLKETYGGYYTLGRLFVQLIGNPRVMQLATQRGLHHRTLMRFTLKLLANLTDPRGGDAMDRIVNGLSRVAPAA
jgi:geranylgeranyl reductase family protein